MTDLSTQTADQNDDNGNEADLTNDKRFNDFIKGARKLGTDTALGADALPKLALEVVRATKSGIIDLEANKDAIKQIYQAYWSQRVKRGIHTQGKDSTGTQVSKLKQHYLLGKNELFDGEEFSERVVKLYHDKLANGDKLKPVYEAYTYAARMANDWASHDGLTSPSDEEIEATFYPKEKAEKTLTDVLQHITDQLAKVVTGEYKSGGNTYSCQDTEVTDAVESLQRWLAKMTLAAELEAYRAQDAKLRAAGLI